MPFDPYIVAGWILLLSVPVMLILAIALPSSPRRHDDEIAHYATTTFRRGQVIDATPEVTYGDTRRVYITDYR